MEGTASPQTPARPVNRRLLIGGAAGIATLALAGAGYASAQESSPNADDAAEAAERLDQLRALISLVEADRSEIAANVDVAMADQVLGLANDLLDQAVSAIPADSDAAEQQARLAIGAALAALGARSSLVAGLSDFGLPSQQAPASRRLAATHAWMTDASGAITAAGIPEAASALQYAEDLYASAYDDYTAGRYDQAKQRSLATNHLLGTALILSGELENHRLIDSLDEAEEGVGRPGFFGRRRTRRGERFSFEEWTTPAEVPAP